MKRIYLEPINDRKFFIRDLLDKKKYGVLTKYNDAIMVKVKKKHNYNNVATEARLSNENFHLDWMTFWHGYIKDLNKDIYNTDFYKFPLFAEACRLEKYKKDMFGRNVYLHPATGSAWRKLQLTAKKQGVKLQIISAFRSLKYQKQLIKKKLIKGIKINDILKVNALPGYSEHHTGCAIDIGSPNQAILETEFENSPAFKWLQSNAKDFNFYLSYPRNNTTGICYEPWHWCYKPNT